MTSNMTTSVLSFSIALLTLASTTSITQVALAEQSVEVATGASLKRPVYLQNLGKTTINIFWQTKWYQNSKLILRTSNERNDITPTQIIEKEGQHEYIFKNLTPSTHYRYQVINPSSKTIYEEGTFTTAPENENTPFQFVVWGDNQHNPDIFKGIAEAMLKTNPAFAMGVGDYSDNGFTYGSWHREFFQPGAHFFANVPTFLAIGNHDYGFKGGHQDFRPDSIGRKEFENSFRNPTGNRPYFSFNYGNSHFIVLDPNENLDYGKFDLPIDGEQYKWLIKDLNSQESLNAKHRFVFMHEAPFSVSWDGGYYDGEPMLREHLVPLFEKFKVDVVFSGHTHIYERGDLNGVTYVITGGAGGNIDQIQYKKWPHVSRIEKKHHFMRVKVSGENLSVEATTETGEVFDTILKTTR